MSQAAQIEASTEVSSSTQRPGQIALSVNESPVLQAWEASSFVARLRGLHAVPELCNNDALIIKPCDAIHTLTMKHAIDVVFVDEHGVIVKAVSVERFRFVRCQGAVAAIEMCEGMIEKLGLEPGQTIERPSGSWK